LIITTDDIWIHNTWVGFLDYLSPLKSELKLKILLSLLKGERKIAELRADVESRDTTILHVLEEFGDLDLITKSQGVYRLSSLGLFETKILKDFISTIEVIEKFKDFWLLHNVADIPSHLLLNIGALSDALLVRTEATELDIVHTKILEILKTSKKVRGISPVFHRDYVPVVERLLKEGNSVELIFTSKVLNRTLTSAETGLIKKYIQEGKLKISLNENVKIALTVSENSFSMGLFKLNGEYDYDADLISLNQEAIEWGEHLFEDVVKVSTRVGLESLT
jgi:predicted transcriptional regulator